MKKIVIIITLLTTSIYGQRNECLCSNGLELELKGAKPAMTFELKNDRAYSICGFVNSKISDSELLISDFDIFDCQTGELILESLSQSSLVNFDNGKLEITEIELLRFGENWEYKSIPIRYRQIYFQNDTIKNIITLPNFKNHKIDQKQTEKFIKELKKVDTQYENTELMTKIEKLEVLTLIGNKEAWKILSQFKSYFNVENNELVQSTLLESINRIKKLK